VAEKMKVAGLRARADSRGTSGWQYKIREAQAEKAAPRLTLGGDKRGGGVAPSPVRQQAGRKRDAASPDEL
jgi:threonyl-tRNA synthetase